MSPVWKNTPAYLLLKKYIVWSFRQYFSKVIIHGAENLPQKGPVILAPNHLNALMDALAVLTLPPHKLPKVFLARADIFKLPSLVVRFIRFAKILPAYRMRDGYDQLDRNKDTFEEAENVLLKKASVCIMPEGNQGEERSIRPLVKGIFRIAFNAQLKMKKGRSVKIIPIGIEYGDIVEYQRTLIINIGLAIDVKEYMSLYAENQAKATNELRSTLRNALESLTVHLPTGENYPLYDSLTELISPSLRKKNHPWSLFRARQEVADRLLTISINEPEKIDELKELHEKYQQLYRASGLPHRPADRPFLPLHNKWLIRIMILLQAVLMIPGAILNFVPYQLIVSIPRMAGINYSGFFSSVYYVAGILVLPFYYLLMAALVVSLTHFTPLSMLVTIPAMYLSGKLTFRMFQNIRALKNDLQLLRIRETHQEEFNTLLSIRQKITNCVC